MTTIKPFVLAVLAVALLAAGCGGDDDSDASGTTGAMPTGTTEVGGSIRGSGSSFVYPLVSEWIPTVGDDLGLEVTYSPDGSGAGIAAITARTVDFGATDAPLSADQRTECKGCVQIPWALSATSIAYHLTGVETLRLTGPLLANIFLGTVTRWNDDAIAAVNPAVQLPDTAISTVHRSDNSGTTYNFTDYLSSVSPRWKQQVGVGTNAQWPGGLGAKGSSGVAGVVDRTEGAIGYVDVAYAQENDLGTASMRNAAGEFVDPTLEAIGAAAAPVTAGSIAPTGEISIVDPPASEPRAYPICTFTYVVVPRVTGKASQLQAFVGFALGEGQADGPPLLFRPLPPPVRAFGREQLATIRASG